MELVVPAPIGDDGDRPGARARRARVRGGRRHRPRPLRLLRPRRRRGAGERDQHDPGLHRDERLREAVRGERRRRIRSSATAWSGWRSSATRPSASTGSSRARRRSDSDAVQGDVVDLHPPAVGGVGELGEPDQVVLRRLRDAELDQLSLGRVLERRRPVRPSRRGRPAGRRQRRRSSALQPPSAVPTVMLSPSTGSAASTIRPTPDLPESVDVRAGGVGLGRPGRVGDPVDRQLDLVGVLAVSALRVEVLGPRSARPPSRWARRRRRPSPRRRPAARRRRSVRRSPAPPRSPRAPAGSRRSRRAARGPCAGAWGPSRAPSSPPRSSGRRARPRPRARSRGRRASRSCRA